MPLHALQHMVEIIGIRAVQMFGVIQAQWLTRHLQEIRQFLHFQQAQSVALSGINFH
jgi:hypothetical protein